MNYDLLQTVILLAVSITTILLTIIGLQIIYLLKDLSLIVKRAERISRGLSFMNQLVDKATQEVESLSEGVKFVWRIIKRFQNHKDNEE
jgi:hypothetical protein